MIHEPLCSWYGRYKPRAYPCDCQLIAKVRRDEREAAVQRVEALADDPNSGVDWDWDYAIDSSGMRNPRIWIREAIAAIKGEP